MAISPHNQDLAAKIARVWDGPLTQREMTERFGVSPQRIRALIVRLVADGFLPERASYFDRQPKKVAPPRDTDGHAWATAGRCRTCSVCGARQFRTCVFTGKDTTLWIPGAGECRAQRVAA